MNMYTNLLYYIIIKQYTVYNIVVAITVACPAAITFNSSQQYLYNLNSVYDYLSTILFKTSLKKLFFIVKLSLKY